MTYKKIFISLILMSMIVFSRVSQATSSTNDWNKWVRDLQQSNPSFFSNDKKSSLKKESKAKLRAVKKTPKRKKEKRRVSTKKLYKAVQNNDYELVKKYILEGANTSYSKKNGVSLLHIAAAQGNLNIVKVLASHGADMNAITVKKWTPLHHASRFGHVNVVRFFVGKGLSLYHVNSDGKNPYILAIDIQILNFQKG